MKRKEIDVFETRGRELLNLALKLDSDLKLEHIGGRLERSLLCQARHEAITALSAVIRAVSVLLRR